MTEENKKRENKRKRHIFNALKSVKEASAVLYYSLGFESPEEIALKILEERKGKEEDIIENEELIDIVFEKLMNIIADSKLTNGFWFDYFGCPYHLQSPENVRKRNDLSMIWWEGDFWKYCLKQDALIRSYVYLRRVITESVDIDDTDRIRCSNRDLYDKKALNASVDLQDHYGFDFLLNESLERKSQISLDLCNNEGFPFALTYMNRHSNDEINEIHSNYIKRIKGLHELIADCGLRIEDLSIDGDIDKDWLPFSLFEFDDFLSVRIIHNKEKEVNTKMDEPKKECDNNGIGQNFRAVIKPFKIGLGNKNTQVFFNKQEELIKQVGIIIGEEKGIDTINHPNLLNSDRIYLRYQIEELFGLSTINCIFQNLKGASKEKRIGPDSVSSVFQLPNVFSRHYILQMALDILYRNEEFDFRNDSFISQLLQKGKIVSDRLFAADSDGWQREDKWKVKYAIMIQHLSTTLFPVFFSYFFSTFWEIIKKNSNPENDVSLVWDMYKALRDKLNNCTDELLKYGWPKNLNKTTESDNGKTQAIIEPNWKLRINSTEERVLYSQCLTELKRRRSKSNCSSTWFITRESLKSNDPHYYERNIQNYIENCMRPLTR